MVLLCEDHKKILSNRWQTDEEKAERFEKAAARKPRQLSGWNIFLKYKMGGEIRSPQDYTEKVKQISFEWKTLSDDDRHGFEVEAQHQEMLRSELANTPLSSGKAPKTQLEQQVGVSGCKLLSARRLRLNDQKFAEHPMWSLPTCLCDSSSSLRSYPFSVPDMMGF